MILVVIAIQLVGALLGLAIRSERFAREVALRTSIAGLLICLGSLIGLLPDLAPPEWATAAIGLPPGALRTDGLATFFLLIVALVGIPTLIYGETSMRHYDAEGRSTRAFTFVFVLLVVSVEVLFIANDSILFLVFWELMTLLCYLGIVLEREKEDVRRGSFVFFAATHLATFFLLASFLAMRHASGSWLFSQWHPTAGQAGIASAALAFALVGFGIKAGFMPFHFWLPRAHPIAPTVLSAFLSGVVIKCGIYGIARLCQSLQPVPAWAGWTLMIAGLVSAIFGVWYALAQHDIKTLLAYHSVENIGIIGIGLGIGIIGSAWHAPELVWLGFGGALLHTLNHAIFKSLLFMGAGVITHAARSRDIERLGGLARGAPAFFAFFLIGSVAISGLPPLNGFISEFLIFRGFFAAAPALGGYAPLAMLLMAVGLAFVGGLAIACFTKINGIMFLGSPRGTTGALKVDRAEHVSLGILAALCVVIGLYPQGVARSLVAAVGDLAPAGMSSLGFADSLLPFSGLFGGLIVTIVVIAVVKSRFARRYGVRRSPAWGCGYGAVTPRMQYTASSFASDLISIARTVLHLRVDERKPSGIFPEPGSYASHTDDFTEARVVAPLTRLIREATERIQIFSNNDIRYYVGLMLLILVIYGVIAVSWSF